MEPDIASVAALIGEPARATMLLALLDGRALPAGELAFSANIAPQTASTHLAKLVAARLLRVETQGRHRYYRLANPLVGQAIEALGEIAPAPRAPSHRPEEWKTLRVARTCYNHLAGQLAVAIHGAFEQRGFLRRVSGRTCRLTGDGLRWFEDLDIDLHGNRGQPCGRLLHRLDRAWLPHRRTAALSVASRTGRAQMGRAPEQGAGGTGTASPSFPLLRTENHARSGSSGNSAFVNADVNWYRDHLSRKGIAPTALSA